MCRCLAARVQPRRHCRYGRDRSTIPSFNIASRTSPSVMEHAGCGCSRYVSSPRASSYGVAWDYTTEVSRYTPRWTSGMTFLSALIALECYATEGESHLLRAQTEIDADTRADQWRRIIEANSPTEILRRSRVHGRKCMPNKIAMTWHSDLQNAVSCYLQLSP